MLQQYVALKSSLRIVPWCYTTIRNDDFKRCCVLRWNNVATIQNNVATALLCYVALKNRRYQSSRVTGITFTPVGLFIEKVILNWTIRNDAQHGITTLLRHCFE